MTLPRNVLLSLVGLAAAAACGQAGAVTYSLAFAQTGALIPINSGGYLGNQVSLVNVATGNSTIPAFNLLAGDVLNVSLTLNGSLTLVPGFSSEITLGIRPASGSSSGSSPTQGFYRQQETYFNGGTVVPIPGVFSFYVGSGGFLALGGRTFAALTSPFTFDRASFSLTVDAGSSFAVGGSGFGTTNLVVQTFQPVPEPAALALLAAGAPLLGWAVARRRRAVPATA